MARLERRRQHMGTRRRAVSVLYHPPPASSSKNRSAELEELKKYYRQIGGRPTRDNSKPIKTATGTKRKSIDTPPKNSQPTNNKMLKKSGDNLIYDEDGKEPFIAPSGLWEDHIIAVDTIEEASGSPPVKHAYVIWKNERKSKHRLPVLNQKCPQVVCRTSPFPSPCGRGTFIP